jgi:hypothetical protein
MSFIQILRISRSVESAANLNAIGKCRVLAVPKVVRALVINN